MKNLRNKVKSKIKLKQIVLKEILNHFLYKKDIAKYV